MPKVCLRDIAQARSGDKGNTCDLTLFARTEEMYELFRREITADKVKKHFAGLVLGDVTRFEVPNVLALKFLMEDALGGGAPSSLRTDNLGKSFGSNLLRMEIEVPAELLNEQNVLKHP